MPFSFVRSLVKHTLEHGSKALGGAGMVTVYLVKNTELEREEAIEVPNFGDGDDPQL